MKTSSLWLPWGRRGLLLSILMVRPAVPQYGEPSADTFTMPYCMHALSIDEQAERIHMRGIRKRTSFICQAQQYGTSRYTTRTMHLFVLCITRSLAEVSATQDSINSTGKDVLLVSRLEP